MFPIFYNILYLDHNWQNEFLTYQFIILFMPFKMYSHNLEVLTKLSKTTINFEFLWKSEETKQHIISSFLKK